MTRRIPGEDKENIFKPNKIVETAKYGSSSIFKYVFYFTTGGTGALHKMNGMLKEN